MGEHFASKITYPFVTVPSKIWDVHLSPIEQSVLLRIIFRAGRASECYEGRASIAQACCMSVRSVSAAFDVLELCNIIQIQSRRHEAKTNIITVNDPAYWKNKLQITTSDRGMPAPGASLSLQEVQAMPAGGAHRTIFPELDPIELDPLNTVTPEKSVVALKKPTAGSQVYEAYAEAFQNRYNTQPIRNAKVNAICSQIAAQVGLQEAKAIMHFYLQQNVAWYVQKGHAIEYALKDLQALRTNMLNNKSMSSREAQQVDKQQAQVNALQNYLAKREKNVIK